MSAQVRTSATRRPPTVFVSYSHQDERWKNQLVKHLGVLEQQGLLDVWVDRQIGAGEDWYAQIQRAMRRAKVAVLIVTADFLTSPFILREEVPALLQRRKRSGMRVVPIVARPCDWGAVDWLKRLQLRPKDAQPLSAMRRPDAEKHLTEIAREIRALLSGDQGGSSSRTPASTTKRAQPERSPSAAAKPAAPTASPAPAPAKQLKPPAAKSAAPTVVRSSGHWVLLDDKPYVSTSVNERGEDITIRIPVNTSAEDAALRQLKTKFSNRHEPFGWAYQNDAALVTLTSAERESQGDKAAWLLTLRRSDRQGNPLWSETNYNGISADQLAEMRARLLLLNEKPNLGRDQRDYFFEAILQGTTSPMKVTAALFPQLWSSHRGDTATFLQQARLHAVYALKLSHTCEHVEELALGPIRNNRLAVKFRGVRAERYTNEPPASIAFNGYCSLKK